MAEKNSKDAKVISIAEQEALAKEEVQKLVKVQKEKGRVTIEEINESLPAEVVAVSVLDAFMQSLEANAVIITEHTEAARADEKEEFLLDMQRGRISLNKATFQNRAKDIIVLVRLDLAGPPHRNPDDEEIHCPHIHIYIEGFGDKWAETISIKTFSNTSDLMITVIDFMNFCNITKQPNIQGSLLS